MLQFIKLFTRLLPFLLLPLFSGAQECVNYHIDHCRWADRTFLYSRQSRSAYFTPGMKSEFRIIVYGGEEYYISVDGHRKLGDIRVRVFEENDNRTLLYDNAEFRYEAYFYFKNSRTRDLLVEVTTEEPDDPAEGQERYCLGVLIEFRDTGSPEESTRDTVGF